MAGALHLVQAVAIVALANNFSLPVGASYMAGPPGPNVDRQDVTLFNVNYAWAIDAFFALSALAHLIVAGPQWGSYQREISSGRDPYRCPEYSIRPSSNTADCRGSTIFTAEEHREGASARPTRCGHR